MTALNTENNLSSKQNRSRLIARLGQNNPIDTIPKRDTEEPVPLSYSQERLWIMSRLDPDSPIYNVAGGIHFAGPLNVAALEQSLTEVVNRHQVLRSRFVAIDSLPRQQVLPEAELPLECLDLSANDDSEKTLSLDEYVQIFIRKPFRLDKRPPLRALLATLAEQRHSLILTLHHMVSDRWSVGVLMQEVAALYEAFCNGRPSSLPTLPIQYADYCVWQRKQQTQWQSQLGYWQQKLIGAPPLLELPTDRPRPPAQSYRGDEFHFELSFDLSQKLKQLAKQHNATLFMVMAAAYSTLLFRYSGNTDFCIGYPVAGRNRTQTASLIGFFVNTLVLRCQIDGNISFDKWLEHLREQALQDQNHQELAFGQLLEALSTPRNASHAPLFQVMLTMQNAPTGTLNLSGVETTAIAINSHIAQYDLALLLEETAGKIHGVFEYSADLFDSSTISRMSKHLQKLLSEIVANPLESLSRLSILTEVERKQLIMDWSGRDIDVAEKSLIHQIFADRGFQYPDKPALVCGDRTLSYRELNQLSEDRALLLNKWGVGPGSKVGVSLERSVDLIVTLLAVLKSGAAYVPLDPEYPEERLSFMLTDASIDMLVTHTDLASKFCHNGLAMILVDQGPDKIISLKFDRAPTSRSLLSADHTAYIIYTSGSTGFPKGVEVSHHSLLHSTLARSRYYHEPFGGFLLLSSFAFDSSVAGIFWTLIEGGCLCLPQRDELTNPQALARLIKRHAITHLLALPSFYTTIIESAVTGDLASLQTVIVAGEACSSEIAAKHRRLLPTVNFYNEYGPTENTVWSSVYCLDDNTTPILPIGKPIDNVRIYVLDPQLEPVPVNVAGELCIGGQGLAQGYLNRPELTAEKFIPNPFAGKGQRLYRTGDLARFRTNGELEFLGRVDHQVKIRGYRVELGEIEERLLQYPAVREVAVLAKDDAQGNKGLVAYLALQPSFETPDNTALQMHLKQTLPDYMVPAHYVWLDALPLTPNGKCDRRALSLLKEIEPSPQSCKLPGNWIEENLADIWKEILNLETISVDGNFFDLGGHSLAAIQVSSRIQQLFNIDVPLEVLFESATIESLATAIITLLEEQHGKDIIGDLLSEPG
ncbi:non-ribosomal peptide synthetase [Methylomonas methanica]|uniref:Amino acid adenylation domain protein n=1 Tax=Methylomonas methanica (strain DSM 25384 / MC09) TaxID=857087 RepID=G0A7P4_METMM|nr:non-ribosomal peptide synthetase [Methylomonas methanica]AEG01887.1 amino acid adenylation domain protein [Methylomonas methanica MC09]